MLHVTAICVSNITFCVMAVEHSRWQRLGATYQNAIESIRANRRESVAAEQRCNFKRHQSTSSSNQPKHHRFQAWVHKFVCLPKTNSSHVPSTMVERNAIIQAGLWEKSKYSQYRLWSQRV